MNTHYNQVAENIRQELSNFLDSRPNIKSLVMGISGGIDSALVAALVSPVCKERNIPLIGRFIYISTNKNDEIVRGENIGRAFCDDFKKVDLTDEFDVLSNIDDDVPSNGMVILDTDHLKKIRMGNIKARMRMIYLYNLAHKTGGIVLGTENLTEEMLSFFTIGGDEMSDFEPIKSLWKHEVYDLSEELCKNLNEDEKFALMSCINCDATDGLGISNTDLDQILPDWKQNHTSTRSGYSEVDRIFMDYINIKELNEKEESEYTKKRIAELEKTSVIQRYLTTEYKRNRPYVIGRHVISK